MIHNVRNVRSIACLLYWLVYMYFILDRLFVCYNCMSVKLDNLYHCYIVSCLCLLYWIVGMSVILDYPYVCYYIGQSLCLLYWIICISVTLYRLYVCYIG